MKDKVVLITGSTSGIGKQEALEIAEKGATIVMLVRDREKAESTRKEIIEKTGNTRIDYFLADISSMEEVRKAAAKIKKKYPVIDVLINNAGMIFPKKYLSAEGYELTFALNHLGHFLLTNLLMDNLKAAPEARIINVASEAQKTGTIDFEDLHMTRKYSSFRAYSQSKLANIMFTYELDRRLKDTPISANAVHPGVVNSKFGRDFKGAWSALFLFVKPFMRGVKKGAETIVWLATSQETKGISGKYFKDKEEISSNPESYSKEKGAKLWEVSEKMTGLKDG